MTNDLIRRGYGAPTNPGARQASRGNTFCLQVIAIALVLSLVVAVTAISIGIAPVGSDNGRRSCNLAPRACSAGRVTRAGTGRSGRCATTVKCRDCRGATVTSARKAAAVTDVTGAAPTVADAMYAPVCTRFRTYDVPLDAACAAYRDTILAWPVLKEWIEDASGEPDDVAELDAEF